MAGGLLVGDWWVAGGVGVQKGGLMLPVVQQAGAGIWFRGGLVLA